MSNFCNQWLFFFPNLPFPFTSSPIVERFNQRLASLRDHAILEKGFDEIKVIIKDNIVDMKDLPDGLYLLKAFYGSEVETIRIIKQ